MEGKVLFITGAARGIGFDIAKAFSDAGAKVVISDLSQDTIDEAVSKLNGNAKGIICDVTKEADIENAIKFTVENIWTHRLPSE